MSSRTAQASVSVDRLDRHGRAPPGARWSPARCRSPTLHSTSRHTASKLRSCTRSRSGRPMRLALSARKRCSALARSRPTKSWSSTSAKPIFVASRERMVARHHQHEAVAAERIGFERAGIDGAGDDADVGDAFGDQADDLVAQPLLQIDADMGMRGQERAQRLGQEFGQRIGVGQHPDLAGEPAGIGAEVLAQPLGLRAGWCGRAAAACGRPGSASRPGGRAPAARAPSASSMLRMRVEAAASARLARSAPCGDAAGLDHVAEQAEIGEIEAHGAEPSYYDEGSLRKKLIVSRYLSAHVSPSTKRCLQSAASARPTGGIRACRDALPALRHRRPSATNRPRADRTAGVRSWPRPRRPSEDRPLSPHLQIYKPMLTMMMSIVHRITGARALFRHAAAGLVADRGGVRSQRLCRRCSGSWRSLLGRLILFGYTWALIHHMLGGIRHLIWDTRPRLRPGRARMADASRRWSARSA